MSEYDQTFDPHILLGHYDLISWFSDFTFYPGTQLVYEHTSFTVCLHQRRPLIIKQSYVTVGLFHGSVILPYILKSSLFVSYFFQIMSEYDQTFDPKLLLCHRYLISRLSDFALYLGTQSPAQQSLNFSQNDVYSQEQVFKIDFH